MNTHVRLSFCRGLSLLLLTLGGVGAVYGQPVIEPGSVVGGRDFVVTFQSTSPTALMPQAVELVSIEITTTEAAKVVISSAAAQPTQPQIFNSVVLPENQLTQILVNRAYAVFESGRIHNSGIRIQSDVPISVSTLLVINGVSERVRHTPVQWWGKRFRTANYWLDAASAPGATREFYQSFFSIVASQDSTHVTITPRVATDGGTGISAIIAGGSKEVLLMKGQVLVLKPTVNTAHLRSALSDATGSLITSDRPIAVVSGHERAATIKFADVEGNASLANIRNSLAESIISTDKYGSLFFIAPMYVPPPVVPEPRTTLSSESALGYILVFVADQAGTVVERKGSVSGGWEVVGTIGAGDNLRLDVGPIGGEYRTSKPSLLIQYSKSNGLMNPSNGNIYVTKASMSLVADTTRWLTSCEFVSTQQTNNGITIVAPTSKFATIKIDGQFVAGFTAVPIVQIIPTELSYITFPVPPGIHRVTSNGATSFTVIENGASEVTGADPSIASSSLAGYNMASNCVGSLALDTISNDCDKTFRMRATGECPIVDLYTTLLKNVTLVILDSTDTFIQYRVDHVSSINSGSVVITGICENGTKLTHNIQFQASQLVTVDNDVVLGRVPVGDTVQFDLEVENPTTASLTITSIDVTPQYGNHKLWITDSVFVISAESKKTLKVHVASYDVEQFADSVAFLSTCTVPLKLQIRGSMENAKILAQDKTWNTSSTDRWTARLVTLNNAGLVTLKIRSITFDGVDPTLNFRYEEGLAPLPLIIEPNQFIEYKIGFNPKGSSGTFTSKIVFHSTALTGDSTAILVGEVDSVITPPVSVDENTDVTKASLMVRSGDVHASHSASPCDLRFYNMAGELVFSTTTTGKSTVIPNSQIPGDGLYAIQLGCGLESPLRKTVLIVRE